MGFIIKKKLFLDFDDTLTLSAKAICCLYNTLFCKQPNFVAANYTLNTKWTMDDVCTLLKPGDLIELFASKAFFEILQPMPNSYLTLKKWQDKYDYHVVSIGTKDNLKHKLDYIEKHFPMIKNTILINNEGTKMDKSSINMLGDNSCSIFLDDHQDNLFSSNADVKILMKSNGDKEWNQKWNGLVTTNWLEVDKMLEMYCCEGS